MWRQQTVVDGAGCEAMSAGAGIHGDAIKKYNGATYLHTYMGM